MRTFRLIVAGLFFAAIFSVAASAQTPTGGDKIGLIAWQAFADSKTGITKYAAAVNALNKEFEVVETELKTLSTRYAALQKELQGYKDIVDGGGKIPIAADAVQKKVDELNQMERDIKRKQEDANAKYQSRRNTLLGPIEADILKALNEFAAQKGYAVILDGARLEQADILLGFSPKADVTKDFIAFYNARPAPTASVTTP